MADEAARILRKRAELLARPAVVAEQRANLLHIEFVRADQHFALEARWIRAIAPCSGLTPLPFAPAFVRGMLHLRGQIQIVLDLPALLGTTGSESSPAYVVLLDMHGQQTCLAADRMSGIRMLAREDSRPVGEGLQRGMPWLIGATNDGITVINVPDLLANPRIIVDIEES